jgi:exopolysaccharide production protein ExoQ
MERNLMSRSAFPNERVSPLAPRLEGHNGVVFNFSLSAEALASIAVAALCLTLLLGTIGALVFILSTLVLAAYDPARNLRHLVQYSPLLMLPILAVLSTFWSAAPAATMRGSLELLITVVAIVLVACNMRASRMILCVFMAYLVLCLFILPYVPNSLATGNALAVPWLGSKNQAGACGVTLVAMGMPILIDRTQPSIARLAALFAFPMALLIIYLAQSGGSTTSILLMLIAFPSLAALTIIKIQFRVGLLLFTLGLLVVCSFFMNDIIHAYDSFRTNVLNKDATLTGRTFLWDFAAQLSAKHPYLGTGFNAFWLQGNIEAEGLWRWGGIGNRGGFNFHNAFVGMRVALGLVGLTLLVLTCVFVAVAGFARQLIKPSIPLAGLLALMVVNYARAWVEEGLLNPFSITTVLWLAIGVYAFRTEGAPTSEGTVETSVARGIVQSRRERLFGAREGKVNARANRGAVVRRGR